jgi:Flp pilus assembly protein TadG
MTRRTRSDRSGVTTVEFAVVAPVVFLFIIGLIIGAMGVFRYQQTAWLAREGARFAAVRGSKYEITTGNPAATEADIQDFVAKKAASLDLARLTTQVSWDPNNRQNSRVIVTVRYQWVPEAYLGGIELHSTSKMQISY